MYLCEAPGMKKRLTDSIHYVIEQIMLDHYPDSYQRVLPKSIEREIRNHIHLATTIALGELI
jgi:hypothetical protein